MPHSLSWAKKLLRRLRDDPQILLTNPSFADPTFLELFHDWLDERIFQDPQAGLRWARVAPELALKVPEQPGPEGRQVHLENLVTAWTRFGGAYRACGQFDAAEEPYRKARQLASSALVSDLVRTDTERRLSTVWAFQGRFDEALQLAAGAVEKFRRIDGAPLSDALIAMGYVLVNGRRHFRDRDAVAEAIDAFGEALNLAGDLKTPAGNRVHTVACNNLALAICESPSGIYFTREALGYI